MPSFNYQAAIKAGKTPQEIEAYLAQRQEQGVNLNVIGAPVKLPEAESMTTVNGPLGVAGDVAGVHHLGELIGAVGFMGPKWLQGKDKGNLDASLAQNAAMNEKLYRHALTLPKGPRRTELLKMAGQQSAQNSATQGSIAMSGPTGKEVASDIGQLALTAVGSKMPTGSGLLRTRTMGADKVAVNGIKQLLLSKVPQSVALGAGYGADIAYGQNKGIKDIGKAALTSGLVSGGVTSGLGLLGKLIGAISRESARAGYKVSTGLPNRADADILLDSGVTGGRNRLNDRAFNLLDDAVKTKEALPSFSAKQDMAGAVNSPQVQGMFKRAKSAGGLDQLNRTLLEIPDLKATSVRGNSVVPSRQVTNGALDFLKQSLDSDTSNAVASGGRTTSQDIGLRNAISDRIRAMLPKDIGDQNAREQAAIQLTEAIRKYGNKPSNLGMGWNSAMQKTLFRPGLMTQISKGARNLGTANQRKLGQAIQKILQQAIAKGSGSIQ